MPIPNLDTIDLYVDEHVESAQDEEEGSARGEDEGQVERRVESILSVGVSRLQRTVLMCIVRPVGAHRVI